MKKNIKYFFALFVLLSICLISLAPAYAADPPDTIDVCKPEELIYQKSIRIFDLDIRRTVDNFITSLFISMFANVSGLNPDAVMGCSSYLVNSLIAALGDSTILDGVNESEFVASFERCNDTDSDVCDELMSNIGEGGGTSSNSVETMAVRSSLLGFTNLMEGAVRREPLPVNLAYYWNETISDVPYVNKALAADLSEGYENLPMVKAAYSLWTLTVRVALGLMSAVLLYTGIMIIMRKKVNTQLVVSVQYAIPKLIIAIFLIIFSYPLGAMIASISWGAFRGAFHIVYNTVLGSPAVGTEVPSGLLFLSMIILTLRLAQGGFFYVLLIIVISLVLLLLKLVIYFKAFLIYFKMIFSILTAPLEFALGAIPGSENRMKDWFLRMAKYGLTIVAMGVIIPLTLILGISILFAYATGASGEVGGWGVLISLLAPLIVVIFGFGIGINMEKHVDSMLGLDKKRR